MSNSQVIDLFVQQLLENPDFVRQALVERLANTSFRVELKKTSNELHNVPLKNGKLYEDDFEER